MSYTTELHAAITAVARACHLCTAVQHALVSSDTVAKRDRSPVTIADFGVQAIIASDLAARFPDVPLVGEEDSGELRAADAAPLRGKVCAAVHALDPRLGESEILAAIDRGNHPGGPRGRHWTLDPIDGTKGFLRGEQYAIALALIENGAVVLGVLGCPNLPLRAADPSGRRGCLFFARRGGGAHQRPLDGGAEQPIRVSAVADPSAATFCESVESGHTAQDESARVAERLGVTAPPFRIDSQCKYAAIARGDSDIYLRLPTRADYEEKIWDHAAGALIVTEAGGEVTDITGAPLDFSLGRTLRNNRGVIATNGALHAAAVEAVGARL